MNKTEELQKLRRRNKQLNKLCKEYMLKSADKADYRAVMEWIFNHDRKSAVTAFTEGPERQIAYAVEWLIGEITDPMNKTDSKAAKQYIEIDDLIGELEKDPERRRSLEEARRWFFEVFCQETQ